MKSNKRKPQRKHKFRRTNKRKNQYFGGDPKDDTEATKKTLNDALTNFGTITPFYLKPENAAKMKENLANNQEIKKALLFMINYFDTLTAYIGQRNNYLRAHGIGFRYEGSVREPTYDGYDGYDAVYPLTYRYYYGNFDNGKKKGAGIMVSVREHYGFEKNTRTIDGYFIGNWENNIQTGVCYMEIIKNQKIIKDKYKPEVIFSFFGEYQNLSSSKRKELEIPAWRASRAEAASRYATASRAEAASRAETRALKEIIEHNGTYGTASNYLDYDPKTGETIRVGYGVYSPQALPKNQPKGITKLNPTNKKELNERITKQLADTLDERLKIAIETGLLPPGSTSFDKSAPQVAEEKAAAEAKPAPPIDGGSKTRKSKRKSRTTKK